MPPLYCMICGTEIVANPDQSKKHCGVQMINKPAEIIEVVQFKNVALPHSVQAVFHNWTYVLSGKYTIYMMPLDYIGDEHLDALDLAYKNKEIAHWCARDCSSSDYNL